jgi:hypothetical protein
VSGVGTPLILVDYLLALYCSIPLKKCSIYIYPLLNCAIRHLWIRYIKTNATIFEGFHLHANARALSYCITHVRRFRCSRDADSVRCNQRAYAPPRVCVPSPSHERQRLAVERRVRDQVRMLLSDRWSRPVGDTSGGMARGFAGSICAIAQRSC